METVPKYTVNILDAPPDEPVCWCGLVSKKRVIDAIRNGAATLDDIRKRTGACTIGRCKAISYSLTFILGMSLTFTAFGAAAGLLGTMFGTLGGPWYLISGIIALVMGGQLMGLYEIVLPIKREYKPKRGGLVGSFLLGLFFGAVSSPCATPVLVVLLTVVAGKGQVLYGTALLFTYAIGHCLLMLFAGTFTGFVEGFIKARGVVNFSLWARRISGVVVALAGVWFIWQS